MIHHFTRRELNQGEDDSIETLSVVRCDGEIAIQVNSGTPTKPGTVGDFVGLYTPCGDEIRNWNEVEFIDGDCLPPGEEASEIAAGLAEDANRKAGADLAAADYLDASGALFFAKIVEDWERGTEVVEAWIPAA